MVVNNVIETPQREREREYRLIQGDCLDVMKSIQDNSIDLTVTSPPYDNLRLYKGNADEWNFDKFMAIAKELYRVTKNGGVIIWVVGDAVVKGSETGTSFRQALYFIEIGFRLHDTMIYKKMNPVPQNHNRYEQYFEYMFVFSKGKPNTFNPIMVATKRGGEIQDYSKRSSLDSKQNRRPKGGTQIETIKQTKMHSNIFEYGIGGGKTGHPAVFPEKLAEDQIISWSNEGDLVFDPFAGSGTTGKMALLNNRKFVGIELDEGYMEIARQRIENALNDL